MKFRISIQRAMLAAALLLSAGCVTVTSKDPGQSTTLFVTRAGDTASIGWISKADLKYAILYSNGMNGASPWQVVPGGANIPGNGEQITFTDNVPQDETRYYRLQIEKAGK